VCPNCGHEQPHSESCVKCGIIYAKYEQNTERDAAWQSQTPAAIPSPDKASTVGAQDRKWKKAIRNACIAGTICGVLTLLVTLIAVAGVDIPGLEFDLWTLFDVFLIFALTFGIYKKNRVCAVLMFVYFVGSKVLMWKESGSVSGLGMATLFGYFFLQGILGTFAYHRTHETADREYGIIKIVVAVVLLVIVLGAGIHIYEDKSAQSNYEGADEPGYYYPDAVREDFLIVCKEEFVKELNESRTSIPEDDVERICECFLNEFENKFSYEEFENKFAKSTLQSTGHLPPELEHALESCVNQRGY
jgi:serine/threonine-protein kinase